MLLFVDAVYDELLDLHGGVSDGDRGVVYWLVRTNVALFQPPAKPVFLGAVSRLAQTTAVLPTKLSTHLEKPRLCIQVSRFGVILRSLRFALPRVRGQIPQMLYGTTSGVHSKGSRGTQKG